MKPIKINWNPFNNKSQTTNKPEMKKYTKLSALLGREITAENIDSLTEAELETIENGSTATQQEEDQPDDLDQRIQTAVTTAIQPMQTAITDLANRMDVVEGKPAEEKTDKPAVHGDEKAPRYSWEDPEKDPFMKRLKKEQED